MFQSQLIPIECAAAASTFAAISHSKNHPKLQGEETKIEFRIRRAQLKEREEKKKPLTHSYTIAFEFERQHKGIGIDEFINNNNNSNLINLSRMKFSYS